MNEAKREYKGVVKNQKWEYKCAGCNKWHKAKDVSVDHIVPAGSLNTYDDLVPFVQKLFCSVEGLQVLCRTCHNTKTQEERRNK